MGRLLLLGLVVLAVWLLWKAFGPPSRRTGPTNPPPAEIRGPDDDPDFLWNIEKQRFKERREREAREQAERDEEERRGRRGEG